MKRLFGVGLVASILMASPSAEAIKIRNADKQAHSFTVEFVGGETRQVTLNPNEKFQISSPSLTVYLNAGQKVRIRAFEEYLFMNNVFTLQRRDYRNSGGR